jgi:uncharacterized protein YbjT (DUF2867 family)
MSGKRILVTGATGQQGGSVVDALVNTGNEVYGLTRNPASGKAETLVSRGVKVVTGDMADPVSLKKAFSQMDSVFLLVTPFIAGVEAESEFGINAVKIAHETGISHIVYSSVSDADKSTGIPHFDSKFKVEQYLQDSGVPFTIVAPVFFFDNMMSPFMLPGLKNGVLAQAMPPDVALQGISVRNIGEFCGWALLNRERYLGQRFNIAGDSLTGAEYAQLTSKASGKEIRFTELPIEELRAGSEDMALMYEWFMKVGYSADIDKLRREHPEITWESFAQWADRQDWSVLD